MHRFFVPPDALRGTQVVLPNQVARQVHTVLRMRAGERIVVLDDSGWEFEVVLSEVGRAQATGQVLERRPAGGEPCVRLTLYQSLLKRDHFEWVLQKCTEVGVAEFVPIVSRRTIVSPPGGVKRGKMERWRRIIAEATEQSRRGRLPVLRQVLGFREAIAQAPGYDLALLPWEEEKATGLRDALAACRLADGAGRAGHPGSAGGLRLKPGLRTCDPGPEGGARVSVALFVGPEGGFAEEEMALARQHGARSVTLGPRILRAETAAVVAASLVLYELGELE